MIVAALRHVRQQRQLARALDGTRHLALMPAAGAGDPPRADLAALGHEAPERRQVLVVDPIDLVAAVWAGLTAPGSRAALPVAPANRPSACFRHSVFLYLERNIVFCSSSACGRGLKITGVDRNVAVSSVRATGE